MAKVHKQQELTREACLRQEALNLILSILNHVIVRKRDSGKYKQPAVVVYILEKQ